MDLSYTYDGQLRGQISFVFFSVIAVMGWEPAFITTKFNHFSTGMGWRLRFSFFLLNSCRSNRLSAKGGEPITIILISRRKPIGGWHGVSSCLTGFGF